MVRDFTYIDDIIEGIYRLIKLPNSVYGKDCTTHYKIFNIGNQKPVDLMKLIKEVEKNCGKKSRINFLPLQKGDVEKTESDISFLEKHKIHPKI